MRFWELHFTKTSFFLIWKDLSKYLKKKEKKRRWGGGVLFSNLKHTLQIFWNGNLYYRHNKFLEYMFLDFF